MINRLEPVLLKSTIGSAPSPVLPIVRSTSIVRPELPSPANICPAVKRMVQPAGATATADAIVGKDSLVLSTIRGQE